MKGKLSIWPEFKVQDMWIGVYWKNFRVGSFRRGPDLIDIREFAMWICLLPMLPLHITYVWEDTEGPKRRAQALTDLTRMSQEMGLYD